MAKSSDRSDRGRVKESVSGSTSIAAIRSLFSRSADNSAGVHGQVPPWSTKNLIAAGQEAWTVIVARRAEITAVAVFLIVIVVYLQTLLPGPEFFDTGEYQVAPYVLGNMHQTGYPFYGVVGKIFGTLVPIGSFAYRMNLMSATFLAIMASMLVFISLRYRVLPIIAFAAALSFGFAGNVWGTAIHADPHPLTALIAASLWLMALKWRDSGERRWLWTMAVLSGLGLGAAVILVAELPAIIIYTVITRPREFFAPKTMIVAALLGAASLAGIYTYLPIRAMMHAPLNYWDPQTWERFRDVVFSGGGGLFTLEGLIAIPRVLAQNGAQIIGWYGDWLTPAGRAIVAILAAIGFFTLAKRDRRLALVVFIGVILPIYASVTVPNAERGRYFIMSNWLLFFLTGIGTQTALIDPIRNLSYGSIRQSLSILAVVASLIFPYYLVHNLWNSSWHNDNDAEVFIDGVFSVLKPHALVLSWWGASTALWYGRYVEGKRPDVTIMDNSEALPRGWEGLSPALDLYYGTRPIYAVSWPDEIERYEKKYRMRKIVQLNWFGMAVHEVVGRKDAPPKTP